MSNEYIIKINDMYLKNLHVDYDYPENNFIKDIELTYDPNFDYLWTTNSNVRAEYMKNKIIDCFGFYEDRSSVEVIKRVKEGENNE